MAPTRVAADRPRRRTQHERSDATVGQITAAARELFATEGYAATSLEAICERADVTKGALYHHFTSKAHLFESVYIQEQAALSASIAEEYRRHDDPWDGLYEGCRVFLEAALDLRVQRITLLDGPSALGWAKVRNLREDCRHMVRFGVRKAMEAGRIAPRPVEPLTSLLHGTLCESAVAIANADDPDDMFRLTMAELRRVFDALPVADSRRRRR